MVVHPRIGCFVYNDSTFWSMLGHGVTTRAAEFGATVEVQSARDADGQDTILAQMIGQHVDALVVGVIDPERGAHSARAAAKAGIPVIAKVLNHLLCSDFGAPRQNPSTINEKVPLCRRQKRRLRKPCK